MGSVFIHVVFLLPVRAKYIIPEGQISIEHSLGNGLYVEVRGSHLLAEEDVQALEDRMRQLVQLTYRSKRLKCLNPSSRDLSTSRSAG